MNTELKFEKSIRHLAKQLGLHCKLDGNQASFRDDLAPMCTIIELLNNDSDSVFVYFYVRTTSWDLPGERTDANELISILLAVFLQLEIGISSKVIDIPNPVMVIETEVYARYIVPQQPYNGIYPLDDKGIQELAIILGTVQHFKLLLPYLFDWSPTEIEGESTLVPGYDWVKSKKWAGQVANVLGEAWIEQDWPNDFNEFMALAENERERFSLYDGIQSCSRENPNWRHYRSVNSGISVFESSSLASALVQRAQICVLWETVEGIDASLYVSGSAHNAIGHLDQQKMTQILNTLGSEPGKSTIIHIPLEDHLISISNEHLIFIQTECGRKRFEGERDKLRKRHEKESLLLFPLVNFQWNDHLDGAAFELMILDLLKREPGVERARLVSVTNERDGGRDIICDWVTSTIVTEAIRDEKRPATLRTIIVQCKAYSQSVGKSHVRDIRDVVEHYGATGYFLAVSSQITTSLTDHLDSLRRRGTIWCDWWTRSEIEERLSRHQDIAHKYPSVLRFDE